MMSATTCIRPALCIFKINIHIRTKSVYSREFCATNNILEP